MKKYTRLNEIFLLLSAALLFATHVVKNKSFGLKKIEILLLLIGVSMTFSIFYGYLFLDVIICARDFYPVFNIILFFFYFRFGTFFDHENINMNHVKKIFFISVVGLNLIAISQMFSWGFKNVLPLYIPELLFQRYNSKFIKSGLIQRALGNIGSPNSFSSIMLIIIVMLTAWIVYMPIKNDRSRLFLYPMCMLSIVSFILAFSRSGLIALIVSMFYLIIVAKCQDKKKIVKSFVPYILLFTLSLPAFFYNDTAKTLLGKFRGYRRTAISFSILQNHLKIRIYLWNKGMEKAMMSPIFGWGLTYANNMRTERLKLNDTKSFYAPHNEYIDFFMATGIVGLTFFVTFFISIFRKATSIIKNGCDPFSLYIARSVQSIIVGLAFFELTVGFWFNAIIPAILMLIFGSLYQRVPVPDPQHH